MLFELRLYKSETGRLDEIVDRMRDDLPAMLQKHSFPTPLGQWTCSAGPGMPLYLWLLKWEDLQQRSECFASLYSDPAWDAVRVRTNGDRNTVTEQRILFMRKLPCFATLGSTEVPSQGAIFELRLQRIQYGQLNWADRVLEAVDLPALARCGASIDGAFEVMSGCPVFTIALFLRWPNFASREAGLLSYAALDQVRAARATEVRELGNPCFEGFDAYLLRATAFGVPRACFGEFTAP